MHILNFLPAAEEEQYHRRKRMQGGAVLFFLVLILALVLSGFNVRGNIVWEKRLQNHLGMNAGKELALQKTLALFNRIQIKMNAAYANQENFLNFFSLLMASISPKIKVQKLHLEKEQWRMEGLVLDQATIAHFLEKLQQQFMNMRWQISELSQSEKSGRGFAFSIIGLLPVSKNKMGLNTR